MTGRGTVACARSGCGALYHPACWDECSQGYGACAIYGCGGKEANEVSVKASFFKLARLAIALSGTPSSGRAVSEEEGRGQSLLARSFSMARRLDPRRAEGADAIGVLLVYLLALPAALSAVACIALYAAYGPLWRVAWESAPWNGLSGTTSIVMAVLAPFALVAAAFSPVLVGFFVALGFNLMRLVVRVR
jgi:hypothetical protein